MNISLAAEKIFTLFGQPITNSIFTAWIVMAILIIAAIVLRQVLTKIPGKFQNTIELVYLYFIDNTETIIGRRDVAKEVFPYIMTLFLFITVSNWTEVLPTGNGSFGIANAAGIISFIRPPSTDLNMVAGMAIISVFFVQYLGLKYGGGLQYLKKFFNFSSGVGLFVGILELISEFSRIISFTFRLFGNIFAGEVLVTVIFYLTIHLIPFFPILPLPFYLLELFVGVIQAFVFSFLVIVLTSVAIMGHGEGAPAH